MDKRVRYANQIIIKYFDHSYTKIIQFLCIVDWNAELCTLLEACTALNPPEKVVEAAMHPKSN